jgi:hypothetical protein
VSGSGRRRCDDGVSESVDLSRPIEPDTRSRRRHAGGSSLSSVFCSACLFASDALVLVCLLLAIVVVHHAHGVDAIEDDDRECDLPQPAEHGRQHDEEECMEGVCGAEYSVWLEWVDDAASADVERGG